MSNRKEKIEAQIALCRSRAEILEQDDNHVAALVFLQDANIMQALLDVAVAADQLFNELAHYGHESADSMHAMSVALDNLLREVE